MFRKLMLAVTAAALALPVLAAAHDDEFESDWGWIDEGQVEEYDFEGGDVSVDMSAPGSSVSFETFQEGLTPYGQWVTVGAYGRVWRPVGVASGWRPYYNGRWEWTDEGWLWVSAEPWGWATYHYGRWAFDSFHGWVWVPGYQWAPAWVSWRFGVDYIGWAPLGPGLSVYVTNYPVIYDHWCFVPSARFVGVPVHSHAFIGRHRVAPIWSRTQPAPPRARVNGAVAPAWGGPARPFIEKRAGRPIAPVRVQPVASPAAARAAPSREGVVPVYRPEAARARAGTASRSGAVTTPGRAVSPNAISPRSGAAAAPSRSGAVAPPRSGAAGSTGPATAGPSRSGANSGSRAAPARPGAGSTGRSSSRAVTPAPSPAAPRAAPAPSAPAPRAAPARPGAGASGRSSSRMVPAPSTAQSRAAPEPRTSRIESGSSSSTRGSSSARVSPPSRGSSGGGASAAPSRGGGGSSGRAAVSAGGGGRGGGGAHAAPNRR